MFAQLRWLRVNGKRTNFNRLEIRPVLQTFFRLKSHKLEAAIPVSRQRMADLFEEGNSLS